MKGLLLCLAAIVPHELVVRDRCTTLEVNHFHSEDGRLVFDQLIVWRFCRAREAEVCEAWRMVKDRSMVPQYDHARKEWGVLFQDGDVTRLIQANCYRETWSQAGLAGDPELNDREVYPKERRKELTRGSASIKELLHAR